MYKLMAPSIDQKEDYINQCKCARSCPETVLKSVQFLLPSKLETTFDKCWKGYDVQILPRLIREQNVMVRCIVAELTFIPARIKLVGILSKQRDGISFLVYSRFYLLRKKRCFLN